MQYRTLGNTDLDVSVICLGSMTWGEQNTEAEAHQQLDYALDCGVNFIDTAEMYAIPPRKETYGLTEQYIGSWLKQRGKRDDVILATKVVGPSEAFDYVRDGSPRLDRKNIEAAIDASLKRLQTDYVDLYQLHWPERKTNFFGKLGYTHSEDEQAVPLADTLGALQELVEQGKVRHIGLSNETPWGVMHCMQLHKEHGLPRVVSVQNPYNLLNRSYEVGLAEVSIREQCGLLAYSPLGFGVLSGKYLEGRRPEGRRLTLFPSYKRYFSQAGQEATARYVALARQHGLEPAQMALAYVNSRPFVTSNIIGATTMLQLKANIETADMQLSEDGLNGIEAIHNDHANPCP